MEALVNAGLLDIRWELHVLGVLRDIPEDSCGRLGDRILVA